MATEPVRTSVEKIDAVTLATEDMARAVEFYTSLGFQLHHGGSDAGFTTFAAGGQYLNLVEQPGKEWSWWGRVIFHVSDVDAIYELASGLGLEPEAAPRDAEWGERYFHLTDPDGHELSFAKRLAG